MSGVLKAAPRVDEVHGFAKPRSFRINPADATVSFHADLAGAPMKGPARIEISNEIVVRGTLNCGVDTRLVLKRDCLRGMAARLRLGEENVIAELIFLHRDPSLHLTVARAFDLEDLAADWQMWAKRFDLPLILIEPDGVEQVISHRPSQVAVRPSAPRRATNEFSKRRPRFLRRRKTGGGDEMKTIAGREIIART
ncbi:MAG: DUF6101 family protein [Pseudomonadota bacterium]